MNVQERLQALIGSQAMQIAVLQAQLEELQERLTQTQTQTAPVVPADKLGNGKDTHL